MNSIPILRFPILVIREILSTMSPYELIHLSMTSKKTKHVVKMFSRTKFQNKFVIDVYIKEEYGVSIASDPITWDYRFTSNPNREGSSAILNEFGGESVSLRKFTRNKLEGFKSICNIIEDIFELQIFNITFALKTDSNENRLISDYLKLKQESYKEFDIRDEEKKDNDIKYLLENLKITNSLYINSEIKESFGMDLPQNVDFLSIVYGNFVKLEQLLKLNCGRIRLWETSLTKQDINMFLKSWMASRSNLNLVYLKIRFRFQTTDGIFQDIPHEIGDERHFQNKYIDHVVQDGWDIKRIDGKQARIFLRQENSGKYLEIIIY